MYVRGYVHMLRERQAPGAMRLWLDSAAQGFSPSQVAIADFLASDYPDKPADIDRGLRSYIKAAKMGHRAAPARAAWLCRNHPNLFKRALAWIALPILLWMAVSGHARGFLFRLCVSAVRRAAKTLLRTGSIVPLNGCFGEQNWGVAWDPGIADTPRPEQPARNGRSRAIENNAPCPTVAMSPSRSAVPLP
jgi:TPR repeat protein